MGRYPRSSDKGFQKGSWTAAEDKILMDFIKAQGQGKWSRVMKETGLRRCGKSCRLRWLNYLRPDIKRGNISSDEEELIVRLHKLLGNRWSLIAGRLPGRTDNEIKNYWNTNLAKKAPEVRLSHFREFSREPQSKAAQCQDSIPVQPTLNSTHVSPVLSSNSIEDHLMVDFDLDGEDIRQILELDFSGINKPYIDDLLSPKSKFEVDDYLSMFEAQDFQSQLLSTGKTSISECSNGDGGDNRSLISSDFAPFFKSGYEKWPEIEVGDHHY